MSRTVWVLRVHLMIHMIPCGPTCFQLDWRDKRGVAFKTRVCSSRPQ